MFLLFFGCSYSTFSTESTRTMDIGIMGIRINSIWIGAWGFEHNSWHLFFPKFHQRAWLLFCAHRVASLIHSLRLAFQAVCNSQRHFDKKNSCLFRVNQFRHSVHKCTSAQLVSSSNKRTASTKSISSWHRTNFPEWAPVFLFLIKCLQHSSLSLSFISPSSFQNWK